MASARFSVLDPVPLRKIERHTRVCCKSSKYWSTVFAISDPHKGIARQRRNISGAIDEEIAIIVDPHAFPGKWLRRGSFDLLSTLLELAAVAGAGDDAQLLLPRREASEVSADSAEREVAFLRVDDVDAVVDVERDRVEGVAIRLAGIHHGGRLVKHIRLEILIRKCRGPDSSDAQRPNPKLGKELTTVEFVAQRTFLFLSHKCLPKSNLDFLLVP